MNVIGIIPSRLASSRFPDKPMTDILGVPMVGHVFFRSCLSRKLSDVYVATCDDVIRKYMEDVGAKVVMTSDKHNRALERTAEALRKIVDSSLKTIDFVVMIQGDLPLIAPEAIDNLVAAVEKDPDLKVVDTICLIDDESAFENPNNVKVVMDLNGFALYYSREAIPSRKKFNGAVPMWRQPGLIMFETKTLLNYVELQPTPLEIIESVDMNRLLEHGMKVKFVRSPYEFYSVDVPEDKGKVIDKMRIDPYFARYGSKR